MSSTEEPKNPNASPPSSEGSAGVVVSQLPRRTLFRRALLKEVSGFSCKTPGKPDEDEWEMDVSEWIKAPPEADGAIQAIEAGRVRVWLYRSRNGQLMGYGSLGLQEVTCQAETLELPVVPYFGVSTDFRSKPDGARWHQRVAARIFEGLIQQARADGIATLYLYVDERNPAVRFYQRFRFEEWTKEKDGHRTWIIMRRSTEPMSYQE